MGIKTNSNLPEPALQHRVRGEELQPPNHEEGRRGRGRGVAGLLRGGGVARLQGRGAGGLQGADLPVARPEAGCRRPALQGCCSHHNQIKEIVNMLSH